MPVRTTTRPSFHSSFCNKAQTQVERLIAGPNSVFICNECIALCRETINSAHNSHE